MILPLFSFTQPALADPIPGDLIKNGDFSSGVAWPWNTSETWPAKVTGTVVNGEYQVVVSSLRQNIWDIQMRQRRLTILPGHTYVATFTVYAPQPVTITAKVAQSHYPWGTFADKKVQVTSVPTTCTFSFVGKEMADTLGVSRVETAAEYTFHIDDQSHKNSLPYTIYFDNLSLVDAAYVAPDDTLAPLSNIRLNQHGYFVYGPKKASWESTSTTPAPWALYDDRDIVVASGVTDPFLYDAASGDYVHTIDFSSYTRMGEHFKLEVNGEYSYYFGIWDHLYNKMKLDALSYFYQNRDEEITAEYVGYRERLTRGAMLNEEGNPFDYGLLCYSGPDKLGETWTNCVTGTTQLFPPDYTRYALRGWYDAGDHGKYVVNGGISAWTLMNLYERNLLSSNSDYAYGDDTLNIPEKNNGTPDILDEVEVEVEFMENLQIPAAHGIDPSMWGMVHHMVHDTAWTDVPNRPDEVVTTADSYARAVYPPSTAATLNFAAVAAQFSRLIAPYNPIMAPRYLNSAEFAWDAAVRNPAMYAADRFNGGGPYDDNNVSDEFYWAAAELYITSGKQEYLDYMTITATQHFLTVPVVLGAEGSGAMTWKDTAALGTISLALAPNGLTASQVNLARINLISAANTFIDNEAEQGYGTPYVAGSAGYAWGSNSFVLNEMVIMGMAHHFSGNVEYLNGMVSGMDYLLGRNAMDKSYITVFGDNPVMNPHHRFWAYQAWPRDDDFRYPPAPPGAVSGGPNSNMVSLEDNKATQAMGLWAKCNTTPQKCYADDIDAFSVNEVTINWNAPLAWVTAYLDENASMFAYEYIFAKVNVSYTIRHDWKTGATVDVVITNNSDLPIENWSMDWGFPNNQKIYQIWNAGYSQTGKAVSVWNTEPWNNVIAPNGGTASFGFNLTYSGSNAKPAEFTVDGDIPDEGDDGDVPNLSTVVNIHTDWGTGYCANVTVTNNGDAAVDWETTFTMPSPGAIYNFWNVNWSQNGGQVAISGKYDWNNILQPGESTHSIGYCANR